MGGIRGGGGGRGGTNGINSMRGGAGGAAGGSGGGGRRPGRYEKLSPVLTSPDTRTRSGEGSSGGSFSEEDSPRAHRIELTSSSSSAMTASSAGGGVSNKANSLSPSSSLDDMDDVPIHQLSSKRNVPLRRPSNTASTTPSKDKVIRLGQNTGVSSSSPSSMALSFDEDRRVSNLQQSNAAAAAVERAFRRPTGGSLGDSDHDGSYQESSFVNGNSSSVLK
jgi:hypothetical protein